MSKPARRPAAAPDLPKAPSTGHPARLPRHDGDPEHPAQPDTGSDEQDSDQEEQHSESTERGTHQAPATGEELPMPPSKQREVRDVFGTKLRLDTIERVKVFARKHDTKIQDVVEMALDEFLTRRGE